MPAKSKQNYTLRIQRGEETIIEIVLEDQKIVPVDQAKSAAVIWNDCRVFIFKGPVNIANFYGEVIEGTYYAAPALQQVVINNECCTKPVPEHLRTHVTIQ